METVNAFLRRKNIVLSARRYGIEALGAMAQGLFCSLLIGTIVKTLGEQTGLAFLADAGGYASAMSGPAMAVAIGFALQAPPLVLFSLATVGYAANALGSTTLIPNQSGAGGPLAVLFIAIIAAECGKAVSKETKVDILATPLVTVLAGVGLSALTAPAIGTAATAIGNVTRLATDEQPLLMGILVSVVIGMALTLPISSAAICAAFSLTGLAGGAAVAGCCANMVGFLRWMMDNIFVRTDPAGNIKPDKEKSTEKIDGAVATIMGLDRAIRNSGISTGSVYDERGILSF